MRRIGAVLLASATVAGLAASSAEAGLSAARAGQAARAAVAPLPVESTRCFKPTTKPRRGVDKSFCVVDVAAPAGESCIVTVVVTQRSRPRRVGARVTIPLRCHLQPPRPGEF